jgi:uncharacterized UBP type Zn finger protein
MNPDTHDEATGTVSRNGSASRCCQECQAAGGTWVALVMCQTCGWVACSDDSPRQHALAHYQETDHPVTRGLTPGPTLAWCYVHGQAV